MYRSRDTRDAERVAVTPQEPNSIENQQVFEQWTPEFLLGMKEETDLPPMQETWVQSLGQEDPLEEEMATHSSILAWRIPWTEEPGGLQSMRL